MKNNSLTSWLKSQKITLTVNNLPSLLASNASIFFFSYPRVSLVHIQEYKIKILLDQEDAPEFRVQPWETKSGERKAYAIMIQSNKEDVALLNTQIEQAKTAFPYEYISWDDWLSLDSARKAMFIEEHNAHIREFQLKISTRDLDYDDVVMGDKPLQQNATDYSNLPINEFIRQHYKIGSPPVPIFHQVWGPVFGVHQFIVLEQHKDLAEIFIQKLRVDLIHYMSTENARKVFQDYNELFLKAQQVQPWQPSEFF
jgi:hypothetical protein